jgi:hypothetical protein
MPRSKAILAALALVLVILCGDSSAHADQSVYVTGSDNEFGTLDLSTGQFNQIAILPIGNNLIVGMGFAPDGMLYGIGSFPGVPTSELFRINPTTGATVDLGTINDVAIAAATNRNGTLYALDLSNSALLFTVTPPSPTLTPVGNTGFISDGLLAFDSKGSLFASSANGSNDVLYNVDPATGASAPIGLGTGFGALYAGVFVGDTLYGFAYNPSPPEFMGQILTIDTTTGVATQVGSYSMPNGDDITAVAFAASVPEPSSCVLLASAAVVLSAASLSRLRR